MKIAAIISEYNPFHNGHAKQFRLIRERLGGDTVIVCLMSGNFVQRGEPALLPKAVRAEAAVACGAYPSVQACAETLVHAKSTTQPDAALVEKYNARYAVWHKLYPALKVSFAEMEALQ